MTDLDSTLGDLSGARREGIFSSFWLAGFESACHINLRRERLDMIASTQHDIQARDDYSRLADLGITTVRDGVRWHRIERGKEFDLSSLAPMVDAAAERGIQVIWSLFHYGWPDDLDLFSPDFVPRFARYAGAVARLIADRVPEPPFYTP
ncbi:MAG TPA: glycosyl transferase family 1, partial [Planctomycetota bacterium]|nr:glycosyl transferase family 1 [Planctomycetota bacterium]